jgi:hypothetical protein
MLSSKHPSLDKELNLDLRMNRKKTLQILISTSNLVFIFLYLFICYYNRLATDDFHFLSNIHNYGIWDGMIHEYNSWSSRYTSVLMNHCYLWIENRTGWGLFFFGLLNLITVVATIHGLRTSVYEHKVSESPSMNSPDWKTSLLMASVLFYITPDKGETWFWLCAACTYLWSIISTMYLTSWLLKRNANLVHHMLGVLVCLYIGGSSGPLTIIILIILVAYTVLAKNRKWLIISNIRILLAWVLLAISFFILYQAEGNSNREAFFENITIIESFWLNFKMCGILILRSLSTQFIVAGIVLAIILIASSLNSGDWKLTLRSWILPSVMLGFGIFIYQWPITYMTQDIAAVRAMLPIVIMLALHVMAVYQKTKISLPLSFITLMLYMISIVSLFAGIFLLKDAVKTLPSYSLAYDQRLELLMSFEQCDGPIGLMSLPDSGIIHSAEIGTHSQNAQNQHLKEGLQLSCDFFITNQSE